ncbi:Basic-leucine zipper domain [Arabidopsis suecica]|uniref:Basic-leucine zipper domain n=1 Tax=Arabidopsis suecica TaxID=45249 RepID=A0A8T2BCI5_ARASU|nr:Basic-leucine zipper domain [Arabidopsis suecica]
MNGSDRITPSGPRSMTQPSPVFSSLPSSPVFSPLPPLSPSPSSFRRNSLPSMSLSPSSHVESRDSSIKVKKNPSLPPLGVKRRAAKDIEPLRRHYRSVSLDSCFSDLPKLPPSPGNVSSSSSIDGDENASGLEFGSSDYTDDELNKIAESTKLQEVKSDPKKVRRILKNREAAARSKQRKLQYIIDLEYSVNFLEKRNTSIYEKIKLLENDKTMMMNEKKEITIRIESMEQQAQLRDALTEQLQAEIERLNAVTISNEKGNVEAQRLKEIPCLNKKMNADVEMLEMETCEVLQNHRVFDRSNTQAMDPNMFNWSHRNPGFYG